MGMIANRKLVVPRCYCEEHFSSPKKAVQRKLEGSQGGYSLESEQTKATILASSWEKALVFMHPD